MGFWCRCGAAGFKDAKEVAAAADGGWSAKERILRAGRFRAVKHINFDCHFLATKMWRKTSDSENHRPSNNEVGVQLRVPPFLDRTFRSPRPKQLTMAAVQAPVEAPADLKRLAFVETAASNSVSYVTGTTAFAKACGYYTSAKETNALKV